MQHYKFLKLSLLVTNINAAHYNIIMPTGIIGYIEC